MTIDASLYWSPAAWSVFVTQAGENELEGAAARAVRALRPRLDRPNERRYETWSLVLGSENLGRLAFAIETRYSERVSVAGRRTITATFGYVPAGRELALQLSRELRREVLAFHVDARTDEELADAFVAGEPHGSWRHTAARFSRLRRLLEDDPAQLVARGAGREVAWLRAWAGGGVAGRTVPGLGAMLDVPADAVAAPATFEHGNVIDGLGFRALAS